ncbi:MAG: neutral/alkaline non-lysosomal ceramidase N-terminal domain-containing protein [Clostridia bacterium]|nr:neutral/alkaline non-lysosomal ceramidase N-terminal domain-containing protein [Clostridia bacterium]
MNDFKVGFARVNINPMMGVDILGYFKVRKADGILDDLEANAIAYECDGKRAVMIAVDLCGVKQDLIKLMHDAIIEKTGIDKDLIYISATHTHTGPNVYISEAGPLEEEYIQFLIKRVSDAALFAVNDLKSAKMGYGVGEAKNVAFVRRFRMKDGSIKTNPGVDNPDIVSPVGDVDERVNVLRFDRENAETVVLVNFANHPDVVGGCKISADWPGFLRKTVEKSIDNTKCLFFNGAQGDVNHVNVHPRGGDLNGMFMDFDDVSRGYDHAKHIGMVVAGAVLQVFMKVKYVDVDTVNGIIRAVKVPSNRPDPKDMPLAKKYHELHLAGKDDEIPYTAMMLTTVVAEAGRMVRLENGPDYFNVNLTGLKLGPVAFIGIAGEPFTGIGRGLKEAEGYELIMPTCITNGSEGYYPMQEAYDEGGYEARSSSFKAGVAELLIDEGKKLLREINK